MGDASLLSPSGRGQQASAGIPGRRRRRKRAPMNAIRAIHPERHEGFWVFDEGQCSAISGQRSAEARGAGRRLPDDVVGRVRPGERRAEAQIVSGAPDNCLRDQPAKEMVPDAFWLVSDGFCGRLVSFCGRYTSAGATRLSTRSANHTGCPDGGDGFRSHPPDGPTAKNWNRPFGKSTG
jgi:hypothetical protein